MLVAIAVLVGATIWLAIMLISFTHKSLTVLIDAVLDRYNSRHQPRHRTGEIPEPKIKPPNPRDIFD
jgi:hypothetical protein